MKLLYNCDKQIKPKQRRTEVMIIKEACNNKVLVITGGTGSFGSTVLKHFLASDTEEIRIISRNEKKQDMMCHVLPAEYWVYKIIYAIG